MFQEFSESKRVADNMTLRAFMDTTRSSVSPRVLEMAGYPVETIATHYNFSNAFNWCQDQYGDEFTTNGLLFWFTSNEHATMFKLAWG